MSEQVVSKKVQTKEEVTAQRIAESRCIECGKPAIKTKDGMGLTCYEHQGKLRQTATQATTVPEGWIRMSKVCRELEKAGFPTGFIVKACGGDACTDPVLDEVFRVTYVGRGKFLHPDVLTKGLEILRRARDAKPDGRTTQAKEAKASAKAGGTADIANALKKEVVHK